jgi:two-component system NtrC family sensor kinase
MTTERSQLLETLRAKAILLLRRERELLELRAQHARTQTWLRVFHKLSPSLVAAPVGSLLDAWSAGMVADLSYQVASVYRWDGIDTSLRLVAGQAHVPASAELLLDAERRSYLLTQEAGAYLAGQPRELGPLATHTGLSAFYWLALPCRAAHLLFLAGFSPSAGRHETLPRDDYPTFVLVGHYVGALLDNHALIAELERERVELKQSNSELDASLRELRDTQERLVQSARVMAEVSRRAGMADIATGVLHNVGNVLNSVNVSAGLALERLMQLKTAGLERLADLLADENGRLAEALAQDERGRQIPSYLREVASYLGQEKGAISAELRRLQQHVGHIRSIVAEQQAYARSAPVHELCSLSRLVDEAIGLGQPSLEELGIRVVRAYEPLPDLLLDQHQVLGILVNLVNNARFALQDAPAQGKQIRVVVRRNPPGHVQVSVEDNGTGIAPEHLTRVFHRGFTTRPHGHGFGLHTSALAAQRLGGCLTCTSPGVGQGATFVLELPQDPGPAASPPG